MRWYDEKLLEQDLKREREAKQKLDSEGGVSILLEDWKRKQGGKGVEVVELKEGDQSKKEVKEKKTKKKGGTKKKKKKTVKKKKKRK